MTTIKELIDLLENESRACLINALRYEIGIKYLNETIKRKFEHEKSVGPINPLALEIDQNAEIPPE